MAKRRRSREWKAKLTEDEYQKLLDQMAHVANATGAIPELRRIQELQEEKTEETLGAGPGIPGVCACTE